MSAAGVEDAGMPDEEVTDGAPAVEERAEVVMVETEVAGDMAAPALSLAAAAAPPASLSGTKETALPPPPPPPPPMSFRDIKGDPSTDNGDAPSESSAPEKYLAEEAPPLSPTAADPAAAAAGEATPPAPPPPPKDGEEATQSELLFLRSLGEDDCSFLCACAIEMGNEERAPLTLPPPPW